VNVGRFLRFTTEKEESVSLISKNFWHMAMASGCGYEGSAYFSANSWSSLPLLSRGPRVRKSKNILHDFGAEEGAALIR
jgi:hypothetical protein